MDKSVKHTGLFSFGNSLDILVFNTDSHDIVLYMLYGTIEITFIRLETVTDLLERARGELR